MPAQAHRAGIYVRISDDREDLRAGIGRQEQDCRALARRRDEDVVEVYAENDTSAFKRRKVTLPDGTKALRVIRPEFRRALADLQAGRIDTLIGYDLDRVVRDPRDLEDLIDICEQTGRAAVSATGSLQLENNAGITMARVAVAMANQSSRDTARRVSRARAQAATEGRWSGGGRRAYGYTADRQTTVAAEAEVVAGIAADVLAGMSLNAIANRLNDEEAPTVSGRPWTGRSVRSVVTKPAVAAKLVHQGVIVGDAPWPPILDEETWNRVCLELSSSTPRQTNQLTHWLSGVLVCGLCGMHLRANGGRYWCGNNGARGMTGCGKISIVAEPTERAIERLIWGRARSTRAKRTPVRSVARDDSQLTELAALWGAQEITLAEYRAAREQILARSTPPPAPVVPAWVGPDLRQQWPSLSATAKRRVALAYLQGVVVRPSISTRWDEGRLEPQWWGSAQRS